MRWPRGPSICTTRFREVCPDFSSSASGDRRPVNPCEKDLCRAHIIPQCYSSTNLELAAWPLRSSNPAADPHFNYLMVIRLHSERNHNQVCFRYLAEGPGRPSLKPEFRILQTPTNSSRKPSHGRAHRARTPLLIGPRAHFRNNVHSNTTSHRIGEPRHFWKPRKKPKARR